MKKTNGLLLFLTGLVLCAFFTVDSFATVADDGVFSKHIKEADGTSNQNTNTGSGIKTNHIQNSAITSAKLKNNSVTRAKIASSAVTPDKLAFYNNVAIVATSGGDYTSPEAAMSNYYKWCENPSDSSPCLLKIMPGVYDIGSGFIVMQPYIDIEGSGENVTKITGNHDGSSSTRGVVTGASNAEIRSLTVENTGGGGFVIGISNLGADTKINNVNVKVIASNVTGSNYGIFNASSSSPVITRVTVYVSGGTDALNKGVVNNASSPTLTDVIINSSGGSATYGIENMGASPNITNAFIKAAGGNLNYGINSQSNSNVILTNVNIGTSGNSNYGVVTNSNSVTKINHSIIQASTSTIYTGASTATRIGNTQLDGGAVYNGSILTCVGVYNGSYTALNATCQ